MRWEVTQSQGLMSQVTPLNTNEIGQGSPQVWAQHKTCPKFMLCPPGPFLTPPLEISSIGWLSEAKSTVLLAQDVTSYQECYTGVQSLACHGLGPASGQSSLSSIGCFY